MKLGDISKGRDNNLALIKLIAALLVIYSHAFPITGNGESYIFRWTNGQLGWGSFAVSIFFFYGGFLIMRSMENKQKASLYFKSRCTRIFPPLWVVVLVSVFIAGPILTQLDVKRYFGAPGTYKYLLNALLLPVHSLPGVFVDNPYIDTFNGPLWTLPVEFFCYILCYFYYRLKLNKEKATMIIAPIIVCSGVVLWVFLSNMSMLQSVIRPILFFYVGMICYIFREKIVVRWEICLAAVILLVVSLMLNIYNITLYFLLPYVLLYLGFGLPKKTGKVMDKFEVSYGAYLTAWPIQQILIDYVPAMSPIVNFFIASVIAVILGFLLSKVDLIVNKVIK